MYRQYFLPNFDEHQFFCFPHSVGRYTKPFQNVTREEGVKDFSLHFIVAGKGYIELHDTVYTLKRGDAFLHTPHQKMRYYTSEDDRWDIYWIQFNGSSLDHFLLERGFHEPSIWFSQDINSLEQSFGDLLNEMETNNFYKPSKISALTYSILIEFMCNALPFSNKRGAHKVDRIIQLLPIMQENAHHPFVLEEWAGKADLTPNYFCNLFRKITKTTPLAYITKSRIQKSKHLLLKDPHMQIKEIAINSGYPSVSYFNKIFREIEGVTPGEFRERHLN